MTDFLIIRHQAQLANGGAGSANLGGSTISAAIADIYQKIAPLTYSNGSLLINTTNGVYFSTNSNPQVYQIAQTGTGWNVTDIQVNVGDYLNFTWPKSAYDAVALVQSDLVTTISISGPLAIGSSGLFQVTTLGTSYYKSLTHGYLLTVTSGATGVNQGGFISNSTTNGNIISSYCHSYSISGQNYGYSVCSNGYSTSCCPPNTTSVLTSEVTYSQDNQCLYLCLS